MKRTTLGAVTSILVASLISSVNTQYKVLIESGNARPSRENSHLVVNTDDTFRYVTHRPASEAIHDITELISTSKFEEEWIFLPSTSMWYEVGIKASSKNTSIAHIEGKVLGDATGLENQLTNQKEIAWYHFHPINQDSLYTMVNTMLSKSIPNYSQFTTEKQIALDEKVAYLYAIIQGVPSPGDIKKMSRMYITNKNAGVKFTYRTVSVLGLFEYELTPKGIHKYKEVNTKSFQKVLDEYEEKTTKLVSRKTFDLIAWLKAPDYKPTMHVFAKHLSSQEIKITYIPFENIK